MRLMIRTALLFKVPYKEIQEKLQVTHRQIIFAKNNLVTPRYHSHPPKLRTLDRQRVKQWILESPSHRRIAYYKIPIYLPELGAGSRAIRSAIKALGYIRRRAKKKGFSKDLEVMLERLNFARIARHWSRDRV
jgi:hypothetical protein